MPLGDEKDDWRDKLALLFGRAIHRCVNNLLFFFSHLSMFCLTDVWMIVPTRFFITYQIYQISSIFFSVAGEKKGA